MSAPRRILPESPARRGWCPSLSRPMPTGDGLLARVHPPLGVLTLTQVSAVAECARRYGNGHVDITARANLQVRGVTEETSTGLAQALDTVGLGDVRSDGGPQRLTLTAPLAGLGSDRLVDIPTLARAIEAIGLEITGLPAKTLVAFEDDGGIAGPLPIRGPAREAPQCPNLGAIACEPLTRPVPMLGPGSPSAHAPSVRQQAGLGRPAGTEADIRLLATAPQTLGMALASEDGAVWFGEIPEAEAAGLVDAALRALAASGRRRMRDLSAEERTTLAGTLDLHAIPAPIIAQQPTSLGLIALGQDRTALAVDAPFGRCTADALDILAAWARRLGCDDIRLSPTRGFVLVMTEATALAGACEALAQAGFLISSDDPRSAVAACPGAPACASGSTPTLIDAGRLAEAFRPFFLQGRHAHVSGCAKGCAHPSAADLTLVGRDGLYDIVLAGRPDALPAMRLTFEAALERVRRADPALPPTLALAHAFRTPS